MAIEIKHLKELQKDCPYFDFGEEKFLGKTKPFDEQYSIFNQTGGVIGRRFMSDAFHLNIEEMQQKYPRSNLYLEIPEVQLEYVKENIKIKLTSEQEKLYCNLRQIPVETPQVNDEKPDIEPSIMKTEYKHPSELDHVGLLSQVLKFTNDINGEYFLGKYCRTLRSVPSYEIDL